MMVRACYLGDRFTARSVFVAGPIGVNVTSLLFAVIDAYQLLATQAVSGAFRALLSGPGMVLITASSPRSDGPPLGLCLWFRQT
jgi:MFS family permease